MKLSNTFAMQAGLGGPTPFQKEKPKLNECVWKAKSARAVEILTSILLKSMYIVFYLMRYL